MAGAIAARAALVGHNERGDRPSTTGRAPHGLPTGRYLTSEPSVVVTGAPCEARSNRNVRRPDTTRR